MLIGNSARGNCRAPDDMPVCLTYPARLVSTGIGNAWNAETFSAGIAGEKLTRSSSFGPDRGKFPIRSARLVHSFFAADSAIAFPSLAGSSESFISTASNVIPIPATLAGGGAAALFGWHPGINPIPISIVQRAMVLGVKPRRPCVVDVQPNGVCRIFRRSRIDIPLIISAIPKRKNWPKISDFR
jgi:hypothetical protein